jgi:hypothetical protein
MLAGGSDSRCHLFGVIFWSHSDILEEEIYKIRDDPASHHKSSMYLAICNCKLHERHRRAVSITSLFVQSEEDIKIVSSAGVMLVFVSSTSHLINVLIISAATTLRKAH